MKVHRPGVVLHLLLKGFCEANLRPKLQGSGVWKGRGAPGRYECQNEEGKAITRLVGGSLR